MRLMLARKCSALLREHLNKLDDESDPHRIALALIYCRLAPKRAFEVLAEK